MGALGTEGTEAAARETSGSAAWTDEKLAGLDAFVGTWHSEGRRIASPFGPDGPVYADERYEWLAGHTFLVHHFDGSIGDDDAACVEILGPKEGARGLAVHTFYDNGTQQLWDLAVQGGVWTMSGRWPAPDGVTYDVRCTIRPAEQVRTHLWEYRKDSTAPWRTFLDVKVRPR